MPVNVFRDKKRKLCSLIFCSVDLLSDSQLEIEQELELISCLSLSSIFPSFPSFHFEFIYSLWRREGESERRKKARARTSEWGEELVKWNGSFLSCKLSNNYISCLVSRCGWFWSLPFFCLFSCSLFLFHFSLLSSPGITWRSSSSSILVKTADMPESKATALVLHFR